MTSNYIRSRYLLLISSLSLSTICLPICHITMNAQMGSISPRYLIPTSKPVNQTPAPIDPRTVWPYRWRHVFTANPKLEV